DCFSKGAVLEMEQTRTSFLEPLCQSWSARASPNLCIQKLDVRLVERMRLNTAQQGEVMPIGGVSPGWNYREHCRKAFLAAAGCRAETERIIAEGPRGLAWVPR